MKVLVIWESRHGSTADIALAIGHALRERGLHVTLSEAAHAPSEQFDAYVIGSAVYAGRWMKRVKRYLRDNRPCLLSHPVWLFSSGPIGDPLKPEEPPADAAEIFECTAPREYEIFSGKLERDNLSFTERAMVAATRTPDGDFRDWDAINGWAAKIADALQRQSPEGALPCPPTGIS